MGTVLLMQGINDIHVHVQTLAPRDVKLNRQEQCETDLM